MAQTNETILAALKTIGLADGSDLVSRDMIRALSIMQTTRLRFVII
jgi:ATP-binding protein involved in chromosome partitioning